ncbi:MAG: hypothetical protein HRU19_26460 [Pseudobacteriovorax sp.]|nr:hypothetical protein [Pseudobacteriovorax sp.]
MLAAKDLIDRYYIFTEKTLDWCIKESETSTTHVSDSINKLLEDTSRVSELSDESLKAIQGLKTTIHSLLAKRGSTSSLRDLITTLRELAQGNDEIKTVIHPIIQSLQFQDRLRQNLENMSKMIKYWVEYRTNLGRDYVDNAELHSFGEHLLTLTAMKSERDIVRKFIDGLPNKESADSVLMF